MRLLLLNYEYPPLGGGGGIETRDLAEELARRHDVHVLTTWFPGLSRVDVQNGVTIHRVPVWGRSELPTATLRSLVSFVPAVLVAGARLLRTFKPDVINAHFAVPSGVPAVLLASFFRVPCVVTLIGGDVFDPSKGISPHRHALLRAVVASVVHRATAVTAISRDTRERALQYYRVRRSIAVIPLGLVPPTLPISPGARSANDAGPIHIITIGRLVVRKGYHDLLHAVAGMQERT